MLPLGTGDVAHLYGARLGIGVKGVLAGCGVVEAEPLPVLVEPHYAFVVFVQAVEIGVGACLPFDERQRVSLDARGGKRQAEAGIERAEPKIAFMVLQHGGEHAGAVERGGRRAGTEPAVVSVHVQGIERKGPQPTVAVVLFDVEIDVAGYVLPFVHFLAALLRIEAVEPVAPCAQPIAQVAVLVEHEGNVVAPYGRKRLEAVGWLVVAEKALASPGQGPDLSAAVLVDRSDCAAQRVAARHV